MIRYILDTDTLSYLMKKKHPSHKVVLKRLLSEEEGSVAISVITVSEIARGLEKLKDETQKNYLIQALEYIFSSISVLEFNDEAAWAYGKIRNYLCEKGEDIGIMDCLIAAHALSQGLILVSNNSGHFERIPNLKTENWTQETKHIIHST